MARTYRDFRMPDENNRNRVRYSRRDRRGATQEIEDALNAWEEQVEEETHALCDNSPCLNCQIDEEFNDWWEEAQNREMDRSLGLEPVSHCYECGAAIEFGTDFCDNHAGYYAIYDRDWNF